MFSRFERLNTRRYWIVDVPKIENQNRYVYTLRFKTIALYIVCSVRYVYWKNGRNSDNAIPVDIRFPLQTNGKMTNFKEEVGGKGEMQTRTGFLHGENASVSEVLSDEFCSFARTRRGRKENGIKFATDRQTGKT